jgi:hypothetical protein
MSNLVLAWPNRVGAATTVSGGSWSIAAQNVATADITQVARSTNATEAATQMRLALDAARNIRVVSMVNHNLSATAQWRVTIGTTAGASDLHDSGWLAVWSMTFDSWIEWEAATWWSGAGLDEYLRAPFPVVHMLDDAVTAQHFSIYIRDVTNADGWVQLGRAFAGDAIQPTYNMSYGLSDEIDDLSDITRAESGAVWTTDRRRLRRVSLVLDWLTDDEGAYLHEMMRVLGRTGEVLYYPYPDEPGRSQQYGFLGRLMEMSALEYPYHRVRRLPLRIQEVA